MKDPLAPVDAFVGMTVLAFLTAIFSTCCAINTLEPEHAETCLSSEDCSPELYCERRFNCLELDGSVECDPLAACTVRDGRVELCDEEFDPRTFGLCVPPEVAEVWGP